MPRFTTSIVVLAAVLLVNGCSALPSLSPSADAATPEAQTPSPAVSPATPVAPAVVASMPTSCEQLATIDAVSGVDGPTWRVADTDPGTSLLPGPVARDTVHRASERLECLWWPPAATEAYLAMTVYQLDATDRNQLIAALRATEEYVALDSGISGSVAFSYVEEGAEIVRNVVYVFTGALWFTGVSVGPSMDRISSLVVDAARRSTLSGQS